MDLFEPTEQEEIVIEAALSVDVPTRREMQEIEVSSRLYRVNDDLFMTATILTKADSSEPESTAVTFILTADRLVTVRYADPLPFVTFRAQVDRGQFESGQKVFEGLLDAIVDRIADILENIGVNLDAVSRDIFRAQKKDQKARGSAHPAQSDFGEVLRKLGRASDLASRVRESLVSLGRLVSFFVHSQKTPDPALAAHFQTLTRDLERWLLISRP
jgi:magnesium transporter